MKVGDLVTIQRARDILVVVGIKEKHAGKKAMIRCFCAHLKDYYWFWEDHLEVINESR